jgi:hypothetical protein
VWKCSALIMLSLVSNRLIVFTLICDDPQIIPIFTCLLLRLLRYISYISRYAPFDAP